MPSEFDELVSSEAYLPTEIQTKVWRGWLVVMLIHVAVIAHMLASTPY